MDAERSSNGLNNIINRILPAGAQSTEEIIEADLTRNQVDWTSVLENLSIGFLSSNFGRERHNYMRESYYGGRHVADEDYAGLHEWEKEENY